MEESNKDRYGICAFVQRSQQQWLIENAVKNALRSRLHTDTSTAGTNPNSEPDFYTAIDASIRLTDVQKQRAKKYFPRLIEKGYITPAGRKYVWNRTRAQAAFVMFEIFDADKFGRVPAKLIERYFENIRRISSAIDAYKVTREEQKEKAEYERKTPKWQEEYEKEIFFD